MRIAKKSECALSRASERCGYRLMKDVLQLHNSFLFFVLGKRFGN
jgi:hypothetical protein